MTRIVVTGGRDYADRDYVFAELDLIAADSTFLSIAHGACPTGVDDHAQAWAELRNVPVVRFLADWRRYGIRAGPIRNREMLDTFEPDLVVAFPGGRGTVDCVNAARQRGLAVRCLPPVHRGFQCS